LRKENQKLLGAWGWRVSSNSSLRKNPNCDKRADGRGTHIGTISCQIARSVLSTVGCIFRVVGESIDVTQRRKREEGLTPKKHLILATKEKEGKRVVTPATWSSISTE